MIGSGQPEHVTAPHAVVAGDDVLDGVVQRVPDVQDSGHVRRRNDDGTRLAIPLARCEDARVDPFTAPSSLHRLGIVRGAVSEVIHLVIPLSRMSAAPLYTRIQARKNPAARGRGVCVVLTPASALPRSPPDGYANDGRGRHCLCWHLHCGTPQPYSTMTIIFAHRRGVNRSRGPARPPREAPCGRNDD